MGFSAVCSGRGTFPRTAQPGAVTPSIFGGSASDRDITLYRCGNDTIASVYDDWDMVLVNF